MSNLTMKRGDSATWEFTVTQADRVTVQDLTGASARFTAKSRISDDDVDAVLAKTVGDGVTLTDENNGVLEVHLLPADTDGLTPPVILHWDLQITDAANDVWTVDSGLLTIAADISRTVP